MKTLIQRLYDGELYPTEDMGATVSPKERACDDTIEQEREHFKKVLSPEEWQRFEKFDGLHRTSASYYGYTNFSFGFRLGAMLMCDIFTGNDEAER